MWMDSRLRSGFSKPVTENTRLTYWINLISTSYITALFYFDAEPPLVSHQQQVLLRILCWFCALSKSHPQGLYEDYLVPSPVIELCCWCIQLICRMWRKGKTVNVTSVFFFFFFLRRSILLLSPLWYTRFFYVVGESEKWKLCRGEGRTWKWSERMQENGRKNETLREQEKKWEKKTGEDGWQNPMQEVRETDEFFGCCLDR